MYQQTTRTFCWILLAWLFTATADAQGPIPRPKFGTWNPPATNSPTYYGILGEVAKPGVYSAEGREVTLQELIHNAGGLTPLAGPAVRLVRQNRVAQGRFFDPKGRDVLHSGDIVLIENPQPRPSEIAPVIYIGMLGVANRPVIVPLQPEMANLDKMMLALGQSRDLARATQFIVPSRQPLPNSPTAALSNGTVLILDPRLLVAGNLPSFPDATPMSMPTPPQMANAAPLNDPAPAIPPSIVMPAPPMTDRMPDNRLAVNNAARNNGQVEATPLPFTNGAPRPQVNETSLPVPGSRLQPALVEPAQPVPAKPRATIPTLNADSEIIPDLDDDLALDDEDEPQVETAASSGFSLWQMLGIVGTVASLVGLAVLTRNVMTPGSSAIAKPAPIEDVVPASIRKRSAMPSGEPRHPHRRFDLPKPTPAAPTVHTRAKAAPKHAAPPTEPHDLAELLTMQAPIETEAVILPHGLKLHRSPLDTKPFYRIDDAAELPTAPHERPIKPTTPQRILDPIAEEKIPAPHFAARPIPTPPAPIAAQSVEEPLLGGTAIERALHQLQRGKMS